MSATVVVAESSASAASIRATKRKLDEAFRTLDNAVGSGDSFADRTAKKQYKSRSLYSILAKYGIKPRESKRNTAPKSNEILAKSAPRLSAILARATSHTRKPFAFTFTSSSQAPSVEYRPSSITSFLSRLATFRLSTYSNKPPAIDAVAAAKCGWTNDGKDRLVCGICNVSWVVAGREGMGRDAANTLVEKQKGSLVDMHKDGCPWKTKQCDESIYRIPLQSPTVMAKEVRLNAISLEPVMYDVEVKHPLTTSQVQGLRKVLDSLPPLFPGADDDRDEMLTSESRIASPQTEISETTMLTSLFGWSLPSPVPEQPRSTPFSFSRATSVSTSRASTPAPSPSPAQLLRPDTPTKRDAQLLHCSLCQRRVGLWAFRQSPQQHIPIAQANPDDANTSPVASLKPLSRRQFDLLREHRSYCPYVVRSTVIPSLPVPVRLTSAPNGSSTSAASLHAQSHSTVEGWRAVLTVILRQGMAWRHRVGSNGTNQAAEPSTEVDGVDAMVAGVKSRGGKELLRYVKGLLG